MRSALATLGLVVSLALVRAGGQTIQDPPVGRPDAVIDLASHEGVQLVNGQWRYHDVKIEDADSRAVGPDLKPSGTPIRTYEYAPHAGPANFDDSQWEAIDATTLDQRRSTAKVCFNWYRINITIPEKVANFSTAGSTVAFEIVIDDYAEVWVNGKMPRVLGQPGGPVIKGFNAPNRVVITRNAQPGQRIQLAVFGINGPISYSPQNFIWIKSATLDFYKSPKVAISETLAQVTRKDPALDEIVPTGAKIEKLAGGFLFTEGPIWVPRTEDTDGYLLFSDPDNNLIYRWTQDGQLSIFMIKSGYRGRTLASTVNPVPTASRSTSRAVSPSTNTAIAAWSVWRRTDSSRYWPTTTMAGGSTVRTIFFTSRMDRYISPIRRSDSRSFSMIHVKNCPTAASSGCLQMGTTSSC